MERKRQHGDAAESPTALFLNLQFLLETAQALGAKSPKKLMPRDTQSPKGGYPPNTPPTSPPGRPDVCADVVAPLNHTRRHRTVGITPGII